jgi:hypothetical protein
VRHFHVELEPGEYVDFVALSRFNHMNPDGPSRPLAAQQEQSWLWQAGGVELRLPSAWQEISPGLLRRKASALGMSADYVYGVQAFKPGDDLVYPYLLVTIKNDGRLPDWQFPQLEQSIRQSVEKSGAQLGRCTWKDGVLWLEVTAADARFMSVILPTLEFHLVR